MRDCALSLVLEVSRCLDRAEAKASENVRTFTVNLIASSGVSEFANPDAAQTLALDLDPGKSVVVVGANGSGKSRLGARIEEGVGPLSHRIPAQRSVAMADKVTLVDFETSVGRLLSGGPPKEGYDRRVHRWGNKPEIQPISDFEFVLQALFAQQNRVLIDEHRLRQQGVDRGVPVTKLDTLKRIWERLLPHRTLAIRDAAIQAVIPAGPYQTGDGTYLVSNMSDGERVVFYLIAQTLLAPDGGVIIIDEPELHIHPSLSSALWDALEQERSDLAFVYITHDVEFAANRVLARKYFVRSILFNSFWDIEEVPENTGLPEEVVIQLLGNRKPVLFIEGDAGSLDSLIYRSVYPKMRIEPRGSCEAVIQSVASFKADTTLHRLGQVYGCIDADHRNVREESLLRGKGVFPLPVAEIENVFLLPNVFLALANALSMPASDADAALQRLKDEVFEKAELEHDAVVARYVTRQIDRKLKVITIDRRDLSNLKSSFEKEIATISVEKEIAEFSSSYRSAIVEKDIKRILRMFDQKGLLGVAAMQLSLGSGKNLVQQASRFAADPRHVAFKDALLNVLPEFS